MNRRALTLVEIMIVVIIIGLLTGMAILASQTVRAHAIEKRLMAGQDVSNEERAIYEAWRRAHPDSTTPSTDISIERHAPILEHATSSPSTITVDGRTYLLVPKQEARETEIAGKVYWLVPIAP